MIAMRLGSRDGATPVRFFYLGDQEESIHQNDIGRLLHKVIG